MKQKVRIYARNTVVKLIELEDAQMFVEKNHRQFSSRTNQKIISLGIFEKDNESNVDNLLGVAQFCSPRTAEKKRKYTTELLRLCFKENFQIVGGASKLIKHYIKVYNPADIFTYQDTTGENSHVYEKCGFVLVKKNSKKKFLIAPNKTFDSAGRNEKITFAYAAQRGIDAILGTQLGEVFDKTGERKTNIDLFLDSGWTTFETTGDKVYEWINPNKTHYTYKITASDSDKYYYGVSHVKIPNASFEDCLNDGYYGSGGNTLKNNKFKNWKKIHAKTLKKEIIQTFKRKSEAYEAEKKLVGDSWQNDPLCLNSIAGGVYTGLNAGYYGTITMRTCEIHGLTKHAGKTCAKCTASSAVSVQTCSIHGETKFISDLCRKCLNQKNISMKECLVHGLTKHSGATCFQCVNEKNIHVKKCDVHGKVKHIGQTCLKCANDDSIKMQVCQVHGLTKHRANKCSKCIVQNSISLKDCDIHGLTKHHGNSCSQCTADKAISLRTCEIHGETKYTGNNCRKCLNEGKISVKVCDVHGEAKHIGDKCFRCRIANYTMNVCKTHGETLFNNSGNCMKCLSSDSIVMLVCDVHGLTKHMGENCSACYSQKSINMSECVIHGLTKHKGKSCSKCTADKAAHRYHVEEKGKTNKDCSLCAQEIKDGSRAPFVEKTILINVCELCGKEFVAKNKNQRFCSNPHDWLCIVCGDDISPVPRKGKKYYACFKTDCRRSVNDVISQKEKV